MKRFLWMIAAAIFALSALLGANSLAAPQKAKSGVSQNVAGNQAASTGTLVTRYRLYSDFTKEHLYTTDANEYSVLPVCCSWKAEGAIYQLFNGAGSLSGVDAVPYYRLYNQYSYQHHWTTDAYEYNYLGSVGWTKEGVDGYILPTAASGSIPLYRLYLNAYGGLHLWTTDANERNVLTTTAGWVDEGVGGYVVPLPLLPSANVVGIMLQGATAEVTANTTYALSGSVILDSQGASPTLTWRVKDKSGVTGTVAPLNGAFSATVPLALGDNIIEVFANDGQAQPMIYGKTVTRNAQDAFNGSLSLSADVAFINESKVVTARVALKSLVNPATVRLVRVDAAGAETEVATMVDTGDLSSGDDIASDGVFSGRFTVSQAAVGQLSYRVRATLAASTANVRSEFRFVSVVEHTTDASFQAALDIQTAGTQKLLVAAAKGDADLKVASALLVTELKANPAVAEAAVNDSGMAVSVMYKNGIAGIIGDPRPGTKGGGSFALPQSPMARILGQSREGTPLLSLEDGAAASNIYTANCDQRTAASQMKFDTSATPVPTVGSNKVYALAANYAGWGENDDVPALADLMSKQGCLDVTYKKTTVAGQGSVEDFKNLDKYGMVLISSHGDTHFTFKGFSKFSGSLQLFTGWAPASAQVVLYSNMTATKAAKALYDEDLKSGRLVLWGNIFGILPSFITQYSGKMADSIVYMSICRGAWNDTMANAFLAGGAKAYLGYSDYVAVSFTVTEGTALFNTLLQPSKTLADAFVAGHKETDADPAEFRLFGTSTISAAVVGLQNGDFNSGTLAGWTAVGDGRVIAQLGDATPQDGAYMAIISTGLGNTTVSGEISQTICLGNATTLSYKWNFFSEEFMEYVGSVYQDAFIVTMEEVGKPASKVTIQNSTVDSLASGVSKVSNSFDRGDVYATGWRSTVFTIPASLVGKKVLLKFYATDVGDSAYDTAVLLDSITLK